MRRTTIFLDEQLLKRALRAARAEGRSFAALVREALAQYLGNRGANRCRLPSVTGAYASGVADTAERHEELLAQLIGRGSGDRGR
jgi:Arc/MetJ family transcription regulator